MAIPAAAATYKNHRIPVEIMSHAVWLYFRFCLSFRAVEEFLLARGVVVTSAAPKHLTAPQNNNVDQRVFEMLTLAAGLSNRLQPLHQGTRHCGHAPSVS